MSNRFDSVVGMLGVGIGLIGIGYGVAMHSKMAKVSENLDRSIEELASQMPINIPDSVIERAVEKTVENEVKQAVTRAANSAVSEVKCDIHRQVRSAVENEYSTIKSTVLKEITDEAAKIDVTRVRSDIENAAKKKALDKFDDSLNEITEEYKGYLSSVSRIGRTFADAITQPNSRETVFRIV